MFKRRVPKSLLSKSRDAMWPKMGWRRTWVYANHRLGRLTESIHSLAGGLATGAVISFLPLPGTHIFQALLFSFIFGFNKTAALVGTVFGNPWTFPIIWFMAYQMGNFAFSFTSFEAMHEMPSFIDLKAIWALMLEHPGRLMVPWSVGGYICAILFWLPFYWLFYGMIENARQARRKLKVSRAHKAAMKITEPKADT